MSRARQFLRSEMQERYRQVRDQTVRLCQPLAIEDYVVQSCDDMSPPKWHLGHTAWFFERLLLEASVPGYQPFHPRYAYVFNSYYESFGPRVARPRRGAESRPTVAEIMSYRHTVDGRTLELLESAPEDRLGSLGPVLELGLNHEEQHQELLLTDIKHLFATSALVPVYAAAPRPAAREVPPLRYLELPGGVHRLGWAGEGFAYDNERPEHRVWLEDYRLASRPCTNGEYLEFIDDGGYITPTLWLSDGWDAVRAGNWEAPLYWEREGRDWHSYTLAGPRPIDPAEPVCHLSYYEADAFARWAGRRLPTEAEWELAARSELGRESLGALLESGRFHPLGSSPREGQTGFIDLFGEVWEWTSSAYLPYPGYRPLEGALAEYNAKFMINQMVLRGGSCATPRAHLRPTYRNFFAPDKRWQFTGVRFAE